MGMQGTGLEDKNTRLRLLIYFFVGVLALGLIMSWRVKLFAEIQKESSQDVKKELQDSDPSLLRSSNYQVEPIDSNPAVK